MSVRLFQLLFAACMLVSVVHGAGRGLSQVGSALGSGWPYSALRPTAAVPQPKAVKLAPAGTALKLVSDPGTSTDPLRQAPCSSDTYRVPSGECGELQGGRASCNAVRAAPAHQPASHLRCPEAAAQHRHDWCWCVPC